MEINTYTVNSIQDFIMNLPQRHGYGLRNNMVFRGQPEDLSLVPSLFRFPVPRRFRTWVEFEEMLLAKFRSQAKQFLSAPPQDALSWLVLAQHHGLPTRLLDWTENPLFALYFALSEPKGDSDCSVVWGITVEKTWIGTVTLEAELETINDKLKEERIGLLYPEHVSTRITAQQSCLTIHALPPDSKEFVPLDQQYQASPNAVEQLGFELQKAIIPRRKRTDILNELYSLGVDSFTIFPDLPGLCQKLKWEITHLY